MACSALTLGGRQSEPVNCYFPIQMPAAAQLASGKNRWRGERLCLGVPLLKSQGKPAWLSGFKLGREVRQRKCHSLRELRDAVGRAGEIHFREFPTNSLRACASAIRDVDFS